MESCDRCGAARKSNTGVCRHCGASAEGAAALDLDRDAARTTGPRKAAARDLGATGSTLGGPTSRSGTFRGSGPGEPAPKRIPSLESAVTASARPPRGSPAPVGGAARTLPGNPNAGDIFPANKPASGVRGVQAKPGASSPRKQTADGLPDAVIDPSALYGRGMMLDEDPLNQTFGSGRAPALELDTGSSGDGEEESIELAALPAAETPEQARRRQISEIAQYGPAPANVLGAPAYWVRVMLRRRVLDQELLTVAAQRKRVEDAAVEAQVALGEAIYALAGDERLAKVRKLLLAIGEAEGRIGSVEAEVRKRKQSTSAELSRLDAEVERLERQAAPLREREAEVAAQVAELEAKTQKAELLRRKAETELEALARRGQADPAQVAALKAERDLRHGDVQTVGIELRPVQDDLGLVRKQLGQTLRALQVVQTEKQTSIAALDRAQQHQRVSRGQASGARQQALTALANAAMKHRLLDLAPEQAATAEEARARATDKKAQEELHRAAAVSYDHAAYQLGMLILVGGSCLFLLAFVIAVLF